MNAGLAQSITPNEQAFIQQKVQPVEPNLNSVNPNTQKPIPIKAGVKKSKSIILMVSLIIGAFILIAVLISSLSFLSSRNVSITGNIVDKQTGGTVSTEILLYFNDSSDPFVVKDSKFNVQNIKAGSYTVRIVATGYLEYTTTVNIPAIDINSSYNLKIELIKGQSALINGKFIPNTQSHNFIEDRLIINEKIYPINPDGTFTTNDVAEGEVNLKYISAKFDDIDETFTIKAGVNKLKDIELVPSGEITGSLLSFVREDSVFNVKFEIQGVAASQIEKDLASNSFKIKDLEIGKTYNLRISLDGYNSRDYSTTIKQGQNIINNFNITEKGRVLYAKPTDGKDLQLYLSDFDGLYETQITNLSKLNPQNIEYIESLNSVYFQSDFERLKSTISNSANIPYILDVQNKSLKRLTNDSFIYGEIYVNYHAKKIVNITKANDFTEKTAREIQILDFNSDKPVKIKSISNGSYNQIKISDDGKYVYFIENDNIAAKSILYRYDVQNNTNAIASSKIGIVILDSSFDGKRVLYIAQNQETSFYDLYLTDMSTGITKTLETNFTSSNLMFLEDSNTEIIYFRTVAGIQNIFTKNIDTSKETQLTRLAADDKVIDFYEENDKIFYLTSKGFYVIDLESPHTFKLVNQTVSNLLRNEN